MCKSRASITILLFLGVVFFGCRSNDVTLVTPREFNLSSLRPERTVAAKLSAGDSIQLSVEVDGRMEIPSYQATVNRLGFVTLPLAGDVYVVDLGLDVAREKIAELYENYYVSKPVIMLSLAGEDADGQWGQVLVMGRGVGNPGPVPLPSGSGLRLSAAIQAAGGFAPAANTSKIQITRLDKRGRRLRLVVNFDDIGTGGDVEADVLLRDGDVVNIPERIW